MVLRQPAPQAARCACPEAKALCVAGLAPCKLGRSRMRRLRRDLLGSSCKLEKKHPEVKNIEHHGGSQGPGGGVLFFFFLCMGQCHTSWAQFPQDTSVALESFSARGEQLNGACLLTPKFRFPFCTMESTPPRTPARTFIPKGDTPSSLYCKPMPCFQRPKSNTQTALFLLALRERGNDTHVPFPFGSPGDPV